MTNPTKKTLRGQFDSLISGISPELRAAHSTRINQNLGDWPLFRSANMVVSFLPMPVEPAITPLLKSCIGARTVALVRTPPDAGTILEVRAWSGNDDELENHPRLPLRQIGPDAPLLMPGTLAGYPEGS